MALFPLLTLPKKKVKKMARKHIIPMGKHKPVQSSWYAMDTGAYSRSYEPETRPEYQCFVTGQQANMIASYEQHKKAVDKREALDILDSML